MVENWLYKNKNRLNRINYLTIGNYVLSWRKNAKAAMDQFKASPEDECEFNDEGIRMGPCSLPNEIIYVKECEFAGHDPTNSYYTFDNPVFHSDLIVLNPPQLSGQFYTCDNDLAGYQDITYVSFPSKFMMYMPDYQKRASLFPLRLLPRDSKCIEDFGTEVKLSDCDQSNLNQQFSYDVKSRLLKKANENSCLQSNGNNNLEFRPCDANNAEQQFLYDYRNKLFKALGIRFGPSQDSSCIDGSFSTGPMLFWECSAFNENQWIYLVPLTIPSEFLIKSAKKNYDMCVADFSDSFKFAQCMLTSKNEKFKYDLTTKQLINKNLCLDDNDATSTSNTQFSLKECQPENVNQKFEYDFTTKMFRNPTKNLCIDDGGATNVGTTSFVASTCDLNSPNQKFILHPIISLEPEIVPSRCSGDCPNRLAHLKSGFEFHVQEDGNLVLYANGGTDNFKVLWASNTYNKGEGPYSLKARTDGNLVLYDR